MSTQTEKKYAKRIGKLFFSHQLGKLVMLTGLEKTYGIWRYSALYSDPDMVGNPRNLTAKRVEELLAQGRWSPTDSMKQS